MEENINKFEISKEDNIYTVTKTIKEYIYKVQSTDNFNELDFLISDIKDFICKTSILTNEYNKRIGEYNQIFSQNKRIYSDFLESLNKSFKISINENDFL